MKKYLSPTLVILLLTFGLTGCESLTPYQEFTKAIKEGDTSTVDKLIKEGYRTSSDWEPGTRLSDAVRYDRRDIVELLLNSGYAVDTKDAYTHTALHEAVQRGNISMVKLLLSRNANPNIMDKCGQIVLGIADEGALSSDTEWIRNKESYAEISKLLKAKGATYKVKAECGFTPLLKMASGGDKCHSYQENIVKYYEYDINATDCNGNTALHYAAEIEHYGPGFIPLRKLLEAKGANPNIKNNEGYTPEVYWQVLRGNAQAFEQSRAEQRAKEQAELESKQAEQNARDAADMRRSNDAFKAANNPCGFSSSCTLGQGSEAKTYVGGKRVLSGKDVEECRLHPNAAYCN